MGSVKHGSNRRRITPQSGTYRAPALEKGLDIIELLAEERDGLAQNDIAQRLGRSVAEIYRMLNCLTQRDYLARDPDSGAYRLTLKLFELSHRHPPTEHLLRAALPAMERYAAQTGQSAHLSVHDDGKLLVLARVVSPEPMGFAVRLGTTYAFRAARISARVLGAFDRPHRGHPLRELLMQSVSGARRREALRRRLDAIRRRGYDARPSETIPGIRDISFPLFDRYEAVAALTSPYLAVKGGRCSFAEAIGRLGKAAREVTIALGGERWLGASAS